MDSAIAPAPPTPPANRWATAAWIGLSLLLVAFVLGMWLRLDTDRSGVDLTNAIIQGERPAAPALPTDTVDGADGLPRWYESTSGGSQVATADTQVMLVNWWASWCGPCEEEAPLLQEVAEDYEGRVTVVGVNAASEDLASDAAAFARKFDLEFPLLRADRSFNETWGVTGGYPETFVVGTDGRISSFVNGPVDSETVRGLLDAELAEDRT